MEKFPDELIEQVKDGGVVLAPTGINLQYLLAGIKELSSSESFSISSYDVVSYVPLREVWIDCRYEKQVFQFYFGFYYYFVIVGALYQGLHPLRRELLNGKETSRGTF